MGEQLVGNGDALGAELLDSLVEVDRIPVDDGRGLQAQSQRPEALIFERPITELALAVKEHGPSKRIAGFALVQPGMTALTQRWVGHPFNDGNKRTAWEAECCF